LGLRHAMSCPQRSDRLAGGVHAGILSAGRHLARGGRCGMSVWLPAAEAAAVQLRKATAAIVWLARPALPWPAGAAAPFRSKQEDAIGDALDPARATHRHLDYSEVTEAPLEPQR
jgi:hypothetical protein